MCYFIDDYKLEERKASLLKLNFKEDTHKEKLMKAMTIDLMSSEESNKEDVIVVWPLHWRSKETEEMIKSIGWCHTKEQVRSIEKTNKEKGNWRVLWL